MSVTNWYIFFMQIQYSLDGEQPNSKLEISTEGIKYAGSKREILPSILSIADALGVQKVFDGFSGTTRVSQAFYKSGYQVISSDISDWSYQFGLCYLKNSRPASYYQPLIEYLNHIPGVEGWYTENYGGLADSDESDTVDGKKKIWQIHNTKKLDAIREEIEKMQLPLEERAVLITSLILAMDRVDSTVGHHVSYLKKWAPRSYNTMKMECPQLILGNSDSNQVLQGDIFNVLPNVAQVELAYFDPPYGSSNEKMPASRVRYSSYYHIWTSICRNDKPKVTGAANRREDSSDKVAISNFEEFRKNPNTNRFLAVEAIEKMLLSAKVPYLVLSYSNQGRATRNELVDVLKSCGNDLAVIERNHKSNVMRAMRWTNHWVSESEESTKEYLFVLSKDGKLPALFFEESCVIV